ncbi:hypothetical protein [Qipengyuania nanhaisediminis]|uniref:hypothetical protein n=1 Tax=Qipengyuania nanhaisediminis TaxID=604088 RepID=UPI0038B2C4C1
MLIAFDRSRDRRVLVLPALFDEANKLRRFTIEVMRALDQAGIDCFLPDLPGQNESLSPLERQDLSAWREAARAAAIQCNATETLSIRAGALIAPTELPGTAYAPISGAKLLRAMIRARLIASQEAGIDENSQGLSAAARDKGIILAGWPISASMFRELEAADGQVAPPRVAIDHKTIGGRGLWLRAEPDEDTAQSQAVAMMVAERSGASS